MVQIIPAILATTAEDYKQKLEKIMACPELAEGWVQIDLMDNKFVQNKSISPEVIAKYITKLKIEAQLMTQYPENWIDELVKIKVNRIVFPIEDEEGIKERIKHIKNHGIEVGLSVNPQSSVGKVEPFVATIDLVLIMSVNPGFGGQQFIMQTIDKVKEAAQLRSRNENLVIEVDGGINEQVVKELVEAGVDNLVVGSSLLEGDIEENLQKFWGKLGE